ncbi:alpha/beta fold hydrolase [Dactylosporangium sp. CA-092794]|uniref:alpha/beta fold hydrolase n=1 Tax=Dactylosporangium sp. CA-092794 TaxID=3239929 RepID=UPI003D8ADF5B
MSTLTVNGIDVHVEVFEPAGPAAATIVLLHGMGSDSLASWYLTLAKPLSDAGLRVVMYDLRGHGHTGRPPTGYRLDDFVDDLTALLAAVGAHAPIYLLGNSFGGTIAFGYAARHPERIAGLATVESAPPTPDWMQRVSMRLAAAGTAAGPGPRARAAKELISATTLLKDLAGSELPAQERIARIDCPVLCVYGGDSGMVKLAPVVHRLLPHARTVVVPGRRHSLLVDAPEQIRDLVLGWLDRDCRAALTRPAA